MEQAADTAETAAVDRYFSSSTENISVPVCLFFFFCVLSLDVECFCVCAVMPVSANGLGISLGFTRFLNKYMMIVF